MLRREPKLYYEPIFCDTRSIVYKGWLIRDEILRLVEFEEILRDGD